MVRYEVAMIFALCYNGILTPFYHPLGLPVLRISVLTTLVTHLQSRRRCLHCISWWLCKERSHHNMIDTANSLQSILMEIHAPQGE